MDFLKLKFVFSVELFHTAAGVYQLLFTRKEGVALIADINL